MLIAANQKKGHSRAHTAARQVWVRGELRQLLSQALPLPDIFSLSFVETFIITARVQALEEEMRRPSQAGHTKSNLDSEKQFARSL